MPALIRAALLVGASDPLTRCPQTFLIAAILAMRHPRLTVFGGAFVALAVMSLLSSVVGHVLPSLLPRRYTTAAAALLFFVFGARMLQEALAMEAGTGKIEEEMHEVEVELDEANAPDLEAGRSPSPLQRPLTGPNPDAAPPHRRKKSLAEAMPVQGLVEGARNLANLFLNPLFVKTFVLTFLAGPSAARD